MRTDGLRSEALTAALEEAIRGKPERLYSQLALVSGLPGTRANMPVANAFANDCAARGKDADRLVFAMASMSAEAAPGASEREFIPMCGVLALGARAARDATLRDKALATLSTAAEDLRFRVREAVPMALVRMGETAGASLVDDVSSWTDGFFQAAAVLIALSDRAWLSTLDDPGPPLARLDEAFILARDAPRAAARWPGRKALVDTLAVAPTPLAARFGVPVFDLLATWSKTEMPELRAAIEIPLRNGSLQNRFPADIERVRAALSESAPVPRDPTLIRQGMRSRGKKRR